MKVIQIQVSTPSQIVSSPNGEGCLTSCFLLPEGLVVLLEVCKFVCCLFHLLIRVMVRIHSTRRTFRLNYTNEYWARCRSFPLFVVPPSTDTINLPIYRPQKRLMPFSLPKPKSKLNLPTTYQKQTKLRSYILFGYDTSLLLSCWGFFTSILLHFHESLWTRTPIPSPNCLLHIHLPNLNLISMFQIPALHLHSPREYLLKHSTGLLAIVSMFMWSLSWLISCIGIWIERIKKWNVGLFWAWHCGNSTYGLYVSTPYIFSSITNRVRACGEVFCIFLFHSNFYHIC